MSVEQTLNGLALHVQVSYHTHIPEYIPKYTWKGLVGPMWRVIRFNILMADLTLVPSKTMKVNPPLHVILVQADIKGESAVLNGTW